MDVWTSSFLEHQFAVLSVLTSPRRWILFFFDLLHHFAQIGRIHMVQRLHIDFFICTVVDHQRLQLSSVYVGFLLYQNRVIIFRLHCFCQGNFLAIYGHLPWKSADDVVAISIIEAFFDLIEPTINAIELLQLAAILMSACVALVGSAKGAILRQAFHKGIRDEIGGDEIWLFEIIWDFAELASGFHDAFVAVSMAAGMETHWIAHHHVADGANQVFGQVVLLKGELSAEEGKRFHFTHKGDKGKEAVSIMLVRAFLYDAVNGFKKSMEDC